MELEQQKEFRKLEASALSELENIPESGSFTRIFSFWRLPSFENPSRFSLYNSNRSGLRPFATTTSWKRDLDRDKFRTPLERLKYPRKITPTIHESHRYVTEHDVSETILALSQISLPPLRPIHRSFGFDGVSFRFCFNQGSFGLDMKWWENSPEIWQHSTSEISNIVCRIFPDQ